MVFRVSSRFAHIWQLTVACLSCSLSIDLPPPNSDYCCNICSAGLSNSYYHCTGCEQLLSQDLNLCSVCTDEEKFYQKIIMNPKKKMSGRSDHNHIGHRADQRDKKNNCSCRQGVCRFCSKCNACSCKCHHIFERRRRFYGQEKLDKLQHECEAIRDKDVRDQAILEM